MPTAAKKKSAAVAALEPQLYMIGERYRWLTYREEGEEDDPIQLRVRVRKNLTNGELQELTFEDGTPYTEVWDTLAPFIVDWNIGIRTPSGEIVKPDPPAVAGGEQISLYIPQRIALTILTDLRIRSTGLVSSKSVAPLESTESTSGDEPSIPTGTPTE